MKGYISGRCGYVSLDHVRAFEFKPRMDPERVEVVAYTDDLDRHPRLLHAAEDEQLARLWLASAVERARQ